MSVAFEKLRKFPPAMWAHDSSQLAKNPVHVRSKPIYVYINVYIYVYLYYV